jgi:hypothetical protein
LSENRNVRLYVPNLRTVQVEKNAKLILGGTIVADGYAGACVGARSNIALEGTIRLKSGALFSAVGYVYPPNDVAIKNGKIIAARNTKTAKAAAIQ